MASTSTHEHSNKTELESVKKGFDTYVDSSMNPENKLIIWNCYINNKSLHIPIIVIAKEGSILSTTQKIVSRVAKKEFNCYQCAENSRRIVKCFCQTGPILCNYGHDNNFGTATSKELYHHAKKLYDNIIVDPARFTLCVATDELLSKHRFMYVNPNHVGNIPPGKIYRHYAGNCDSITTKYCEKNKSIRLVDYALKKYWILMYTLLSDITRSWGYPGKRHCTKQCLQTILSLCSEVTYAEEHFGFTLHWMIEILDMFSEPFDNIPMNEKIHVVATAICSGNINYDDNGSTSVVHFQYAQMNGTIRMWMESAQSRTGLKTMMSNLCDPMVKGRRDINNKVSVQSINRAESILGDFTNTMATTKSLREYYSDYKGKKCFWQAPVENSGARSAFAQMRASSTHTKFSVPEWNENKPINNQWSIPDIIQALESGEDIYITQQRENCIITHTTIDTEYLSHKPVPEKGGLMWSFLGNRRGFVDDLTKHSKYEMFKIVAIHYIKTGAFMNYVFVTDKSNILSHFIKNNPVMLEACLSSRGNRHLGSIVAKLRTSTKIARPVENELCDSNVMIGIGACKGPEGRIVGGEIAFRIWRDGRFIQGAIKYFDKPRIETNSDIYSGDSSCYAKRYCTNCGAPRSSKLQSFCGNCGNRF